MLPVVASSRHNRTFVFEPGRHPLSLSPVAHRDPKAVNGRKLQYSGWPAGRFVRGSMRRSEPSFPVYQRYGPAPTSSVGASLPRGNTMVAMIFGTALDGVFTGSGARTTE